MEGQMDGWKEERMEGVWMDEKMNGRMRRRMD